MKHSRAILLVVSLFCASLHAQKMLVQSVDVRAYPSLIARVHAFDSSFNRVELSPSKDKLVFDNLTRQTLGVISCSPLSKPKPISVAFAFDGTSQRHLKLYQDGLNAWLRRIDSTSQTALVEFGARPYIVRDFDVNPDSLKKSAASFITTSGTNVQRALGDSLCGAMIVASRGLFKRYVVLVSDGHSPLNYSVLDSLARRFNISVHVISLGIKADDDLQRLAQSTDGVVIDNISDDQIVGSFHMLAQICSGAEACQVQWTTDSTLCSRLRSVRLDSRSLSVTSLYQYSIPDSIRRHLTSRTSFIDVGPVPDGAHFDSTFTVTAVGGRITLGGIVSDNPQFEILGSSVGVTLNKNFSYTFTVRFHSTDDYRRIARISVLNDGCDSVHFHMVANSVFNPALSPRLVNFRGAENIQAGSFNTIHWSGVTPIDSVIIQYSVDAGTEWHTINAAAVGLQQIWKAPDTVAQHCFIRIASNPQSVFRYSDSSFTISRPNLKAKPIDCGIVRVDNQREVIGVGTVCNTTNTLLRIDSVHSSTLNFTPVSGYPNTLALGSCADIGVRFSPQSFGLLYDTLSVFTNFGIVRTPVSGVGKDATASSPEYVNIGRIAIGVTFDTLVASAICKSSTSVVRVLSASSTFPDTVHFQLPTQITSAVLTDSDPCKSLHFRFYCTQVGRFSSRVLIETDTETYELVLYGRAVCAPPEPHYGIIVPDSLKVSIGGELDVPIQYFPAPYIYRQMKRPYIITLRLNKSILFPTKGTPLGTIVGDDRVITVSGVGFEKGDTLLTLHFKGALGTVDQTLIRLESFSWLDDCLFKPPLLSGRVFVSNVCRAGGLRQFVYSDSLSFKLIQPNPAHEQTQITFSLRERGMSMLDIVDVFGRQVVHVFEEDLKQGEYTATVDLHDLPAGEYYAVLATPTGKISTLIGVMR